jgi:hypothetical protein
VQPATPRGLGAIRAAERDRAMSLLSADQRLQIVALIVNFLGMPVQPQALQALVGLELRARVRATDPMRVASWVLAQALAQPDHTMLKQIVGLVDGAGTLLEVHALIGQLDNGQTPWTPPPVALWVPADWPFVDRDDLRATLDEMAVGHPPAAITVEGPMGFGKKTMWLYIDRLATQLGTFSTVYSELRQQPVPGALDSIVLDLRDKLELGFPDDPTHTEPERRAVVLARDLVLDAADRTNPVWFVVNIVETAGLEDGLLRFVDELLRLVQLEPESTPLRIVLLSDSASLSGLTNLPPIAARRPLPDVAITAIKAWLVAAVPNKPTTLYDIAAHRVVERVADADSFHRLEMLKRHLKATYQTLAGTPDG